ncbi:DUF298-domain-containing protein [Peniophora sp. CONT]|nr:DUF298-domain-containing protein [Peniophora sp. CONT]
MGFFSALCCIPGPSKPRRLREANEVSVDRLRSPEAKAPIPAAPAFEPYNAKAADHLFAEYADADDPNTIDPDGLANLCTAAQISMEGAMPLLLSWQMDETEMMKLTKEHWIKATGELQISSLPALALALNELYDLLILRKPPVKPKDGREPYNRARYNLYARDPKKAFGEFYGYLYKLVTPPGSRNIEVDTALTLWTVTLAPAYPVVTEVVEFVNEAGSFKAVNKDLWSMMLEFCNTVKADLSNYDADDGAWPTMIDDFVDWKKSKDKPSGEHAVTVD